MNLEHLSGCMLPFPEWKCALLKTNSIQCAMNGCVQPRNAMGTIFPDTDWYCLSRDEVSDSVILPCAWTVRSNVKNVSRFIAFTAYGLAVLWYHEKSPTTVPTRQVQSLFVPIASYPSILKEQTFRFLKWLLFTNKKHIMAIFYSFRRAFTVRLNAFRLGVRRIPFRMDTWQFHIG